MGAYKDKERNTWYASFYYRDWNGENKKKTKRGFATKKEALEFENEFIMLRSSSVNIPLSVFFKMYEQDKKTKAKTQYLAHEGKYCQYSYLAIFWRHQS